MYRNEHFWSWQAEIIWRSNCEITKCHALLWGCGCKWCHQAWIWVVWDWRADLGSSEFCFCLDLDLGPCPVFCLTSPILARIWSQSTKERGATRPALVCDHPQYLVTQGCLQQKILWLVCLMGISLPGCLLLVIFWLLTTSLCLLWILSCLCYILSWASCEAHLPPIFPPSEKSLSYHFNKHQSSFFFFFLNFTH